MTRIHIHPGEILKEEFMEPYKLSANALARNISVPPNRISEIVRGRRDITADTAKRLAAYFKMTPEFWMNLQNWYDLTAAEDAHADEYAGIKPVEATV
ncbi:HigA family addiction module antitoxin [Eilatimonas milleporae]|uniref:Addiction module HigA family antidote n=1 Tax=Eilatimonas milleporae TaxID=911205 RepID=A0A3M0CU00_9PROT|nr:HigA family addiction module antitoxin [Eilatimonas milleporae]RMB11930.1 addiction module HigA family antidote [Eilatimonas milleporae]